MPLETIETSSKETQFDIVAVPAIGGDSRPTWRYPGYDESQTWDSLYRNLPEAQLHLYTFPEPGPLETYGLEDYALDLLRCLSETCSSAGTDRRPIHFAAYSSGGLVVKSALVIAQTSSVELYARTASCCFSIAFFGVPHYGSTILSEDVFKQSIRLVMDMPAPMETKLRAELSAENPKLIALSHKFVPLALGLRKIWAFVEAHETTLKVLLASPTGESLETIDMPVVDRRSAILSSSSMRIGTEEVVKVYCGHARLSRFGDDPSYPAFIEYINGLRSMRDISLGPTWVEHSVIADIHQFYEPDSGIILWSMYPSVHDLLTKGPRECLKERHKPDINQRKSRRESVALTSPSIAVSAPVEAAEDVPYSSSEKPSRNVPAITISAPAEADGGTPSPNEQPNFNHSSSELTIALQRHALQRDKSVRGKQGTFQLQMDESVPGKQSTFQLPDARHSRFRWVHVPANNMSWVPKVFRCLAEEQRNPFLFRTLLHPKVWDTMQSVARHGLPHGRFMRASCELFRPETTVKNGPGTSVELASPITDNQLFVYFPYLHWDTYGKLMERNKMIKETHEKAHSHTMAEEDCKGLSMEHQLICQYITNFAELPLHHRRSLDQYGYPLLADTSVRDSDQVLYKRTRARRDPIPSGSTTRGKSQRNGVFDNKLIWQDFTTPAVPNMVNSKSARKSELVKIIKKDIAHWKASQHTRPSWTHPSDYNSKVLMVDQLWCWVVDSRTIVTFFPAKEKETGETAAEIGDLRDSLYNDVNGDPRFASQCRTCFDFAALAIYHAVIVFLEKVTDKDLQVFRIFEEYISEQSEAQIVSLKRFRNDMNESKNDKTIFRLLDYEDDITNLLELRDVEDELGTLLKLFAEQTSVVERMLVNFKNIPAQGVSPWAVQWLHDALEKIKGYRIHVEEMIKSCQSAQDAYKSLLDMKQKQANVDEASATRLSGEMAAKQSRAIMIFTVFTIIFLPLSFFTSLFGMNTREWSGSSTNPHLHTIFVIMFPVSVAVIIIVLFTAILVMDQPTRQLVAWTVLESWRSIPQKIAGFISPLRSRTERQDRIHEEDLESGQTVKQGLRSGDPSRTRGKPVSKAFVEFVGSNGRPKSNVD